MHPLSSDGHSTTSVPVIEACLTESVIDPNNAARAAAACVRASALLQAGTAIASRMPTTSIAITASTRVNPHCSARIGVLLPLDGTQHRSEEHTPELP